MRVIGLTGGIATGKSTVAAILRARGVPVLDADRVAREVVAPGQPALAAIAEAFGPEVLQGDGTLDRAAMRARISADPDAKATLESITHPAILQTIAERLRALAQGGTEIAVVEAALMVETGSYRNYPVVVVVRCSPETQLARVMARDGATEEAARALIATQMPMADKAAAASHVLDNDGDLSSLAVATHALWDELIST